MWRTPNSRTAPLWQLQPFWRVSVVVKWVTDGLWLVIVKRLKFVKLLAINIPTTWCEQPTHWKRPWCWERLKAEGREGDRGWDGWTASVTPWTWTWANSGRWWGTGSTAVHGAATIRMLFGNWTTATILTIIISSPLSATEWQEFCTNKVLRQEYVTFGIITCHVCLLGEKLRVAVLLHTEPVLSRPPQSALSSSLLRSPNQDYISSLRECWLVSWAHGCWKNICGLTD